MKQKIRIIVMSMLSLVASFSFAYGKEGQWSDISRDAMSSAMEAMNNRLSHMLTYAVNVTDESFATYTSTAYHEKYAGYFKREGSNFHSYLGSIVTIQNKYCRIAVDSSKKIIMVSDPMDYLNQMLNASDYSLLLKVCTKIQEAHTGSRTSYRLEFAAGYPMSAYEITLKDSLPEKIIIFYDKEVKGTNEKISAKPRLEIYFDSWATKPPIAKGDFSIDKYLNKEGNTYTLKLTYSGKYKFFDERVLTRNDKK